MGQVAKQCDKARKISHPIRKPSTILSWSDQVPVQLGTHSKHIGSWLKGEENNTVQYKPI